MIESWQELALGGGLHECELEGYGIGEHKASSSTELMEVDELLQPYFTSIFQFAE